jgi:hypothetical protein
MVMDQARSYYKGTRPIYSRWVLAIFFMRINAALKLLSSPLYNKRIEARGNKAILAQVVPKL